MATEEKDPRAIARVIADTLEARQVPYAIGGAIAYGYWGVVRATQDVDLNVFVGADSVNAVRDALTASGVAIDAADLLKAQAEGGHGRGWVDEVAVDIFFNSIPLHDSAAEPVAIRPLIGRPARILSAEDLTVLKRLFFRTKDLADVERILAVQGSALDRDYVRRWLVDAVGDDDKRVIKWDEMARAIPGTTSPA